MRRKVLKAIAGCLSMVMMVACLAGCGSQASSVAPSSGTSGSASKGGTTNTGTTASTATRGQSETGGNPSLKGMGNTVSNILAGGRYTTDGNKIYGMDYENAAMLYYINQDGMQTDFGYVEEGVVGYLNVCGDYLYYMTYGGQKAVKRTVNASYSGYNIYRKHTSDTQKKEELVVSGVSDYGTGFYIVNGILYCNGDNKEILKVDLSTDDFKVSKESGKVLLAVNEQGLYYADRSSGAGACQYKDESGETKEFSIGKIFSATSFALPQTGDLRYAITIEGLNYYYIDGVLDKAITSINKVSPNGKEILCNLTTAGFDHATGLFAVDGVLYCSLGHHDKNSYINGEIELDGLAYLKDGNLMEITGTDDNSHILYIDSKTAGICIYKTNGKYYSTNLTGKTSGKYCDSQLNKLLYEPTKKTVSKAVVSIGHEENIP